MWKFSLFATSAFVFTGTAVVAQSCDLGCLHGGTCVEGPATFTDHATTYDNGNEFAIFVDKDLDNMHCDCTGLWTGIKCERSFVECDDGAHQCFHGGLCMEGNEDLFGTTRHICDCSNARSDDKKYVGKWCEREESNACDQQGEFCGDNGTCVPGTGVISCECNGGFTGDHCEYEASAVPDCDMQCASGGQCRLGPLDLPDDLDYTQNFWHGDSNSTMHCECREGYFGLLCERGSMQCGDKHCFNGAQCIIHTSPENVSENYCNCTPANTVSKNFAGKHCQYEAVGFCDFEGQPGQLYCVNDGECPDNQEDGCICPDGYSGARCEFHKDEEDIEEYKDCTTKCDNGGKCVKGVKDHGPLKFHMNQIGSIVNETVNEKFEHCLCPTGFAGLNCEHSVETCGDNLHFCFNGGTCVLMPSGSYGCDCSDTDGVGQFCQHRPDDENVEQCPSSAGFPAGSFCTNGGVCDIQTDPTGQIARYCVCSSRYVGDHCEFLDGTNVPTSEQPSRSYQTTNNDLNRKVVISCVVAGVIGLVVIMLVVARTEFSKPRTEETAALASSVDGASSRTDTTSQLPPDSPVV